MFTAAKMYHLACWMMIDFHKTKSRKVGSVLSTDDPYKDVTTYQTFFGCKFSWKEKCVLDYFFYVNYEDLCAIINPSTSKISKIEIQLSQNLTIH